MKIAKSYLKRFNEPSSKRLRAFAALSFAASIVLLFFASANSNFIWGISDLYAFSRDISMSESKYSFTRFSLTEEQTYDSFAGELNRIDHQFDLMTRTGCVSFFARSTEQREKKNYSVLFCGKEMGVETGVLTCGYLCYDLRSNGCLHGIPLEPYFNNGATCDINGYGEYDAGSYIPDFLAEKLIESNKEINTFNELIGMPFSVSDGREFRTYRISNIISTSTYAGEAIFDFFGCFVITNDRAIFNGEHVSFYQGINADIFLSFDLVNYFRSSFHKPDYLLVKTGGKWTQNDVESNIIIDILKSELWSFSVMEIVLLLFGVFCIVLSLLALSKAQKRKRPKKSASYSLLAIFFVLLVAFNLLHLFFPTNTLLFCYLNFIVILPFELLFFELLVSMLLNRSGK